MPEVATHRTLKAILLLLVALSLPVLAPGCGEEHQLCEDECGGDKECGPGVRCLIVTFPPPARQLCLPEECEQCFEAVSATCNYDVRSEGNRITCSFTRCEKTLR